MPVQSGMLREVEGELDRPLAAVDGEREPRRRRPAPARSVGRRGEEEPEDEADLRQRQRVRLLAGNACARRTPRRGRRRAASPHQRIETPPAAGGPPWARIGRPDAPAASAATAAMNSQTAAGPSQSRNRLDGLLLPRLPTSSTRRPSSSLPTSWRRRQAALDQLEPDQLLPTSCCRTSCCPTSCCRSSCCPTSCSPTSVPLDQLEPDQLLPVQTVPDQLLPDQPLPVQVLPFQGRPDQRRPVASSARHRGRVERLAEDVLLAGEHDAVAGQVVAAARELERARAGRSRCQSACRRTARVASAPRRGRSRRRPGEPALARPGRTALLVK